jgi:uncharacterized linocin/CFP29 family protein
MNHLNRSLAPISNAAWEELDDTAKEQLRPALAARKLVDFSGPHGWEYSATNLGRASRVAGAPVDGVDVMQRRVLPMIELRDQFTLSLSELRDIDRGAEDADLGPLEQAAQRIARAENTSVLHGFSAASIDGVTEASSHPPITLSEDFDDYPGHAAKAVEMLLTAGIDGPYGIALGPRCYTGVIETTEHGGILVFDHLRKILDGPIVWAPGVDGAVVMSLRGGDFLFESGQDLSLGYLSHDAQSVSLYLEESFSFRVATEEAAVALVHEG